MRGDQSGPMPKPAPSPGSVSGLEFGRIGILVRLRLVQLLLEFHEWLARLERPARECRMVRCISRRPEQGITRPGWCAAAGSRGKLTFLEVRDQGFLCVGQDPGNLETEVLLDNLQFFPLG